MSKFYIYDHDNEDADLFNCLEDKLLCFKKSEVEELKDE